MIGPEQVLELLRRRPFRPFRVHVKDGRVFNVHYPHIDLVLTKYVAIGSPMEYEGDVLVDDVDRIDYERIDRIEMLVSATDANP